MSSKFLSTLLFYFALIAIVSASDSLSIITLYPSTIAAYDVEQGLKISCIEEGFTDQKGRLWLNPCRHRTIYIGESFFHFDGVKSYSFSLSEMEDGTPASSWFITDILPSGFFIGSNQYLTYAFYFHPETLERGIFPFKEGEQILNVISNGERAGIVLTKSATAFHIYKITTEKSQLLKTIEVDMSGEGFPDLTPAVISGNNLWFLYHRKGAIQYNLENKVSKTYLWNDLLNTEQEFSFDQNLMVDQNGKVTVFISEMDFFYDLDLQTSQLIPNIQFNKLLKSLPKRGNALAKLQKDQAGNMMLSINWTKKTAGASSFSHQSLFLIDSDNQLYDYEPILSEISKVSRFEQILEDGRTVHAKTILSPNFKKEAIITIDGGVFALEIKDEPAINYYLDRASRGIVELSSQNLLVHSDNGWFYTAKLNGEQSNFSTENIGSLICNKDFKVPALAQIVYQDNGDIWFPSTNQLVQFNKSEQSCTVYPVGLSFLKFTLLNKREVAFIHEQKLYLYDLVQKEAKPFLIDGTPLEIGGGDNELFVSKNEILWIASLNGLWKIDYRSGIAQQLTQKNGFRDRRVLCIHEAEDGKLWIGLMDGGLHIYDPENGSLKIIDQKDGLSNNTIVGILADEDGDKWVATFSGITVLRNDGTILFKLYEKDGLSNKEFNRFSYHKLEDGRLVFGTISGINVLEPQKIKPIFIQKKDLSLFLTEISYFDSNDGKDTLLQGQFNNLEKIILSPTHRYVTLNFATSDFIHTQNNTFSYQIVGIQEDSRENAWTSIGNNSSFTLNDLPIGDYTILIRGTDYKGQIIDELVAVPIKVKQFFYKTWWFYLLCSLPIIAIGIFWAWRILTDKKRLEAEVERRTQQIEKDKQLIEQQAVKLQELDDLKSRFFTNISHEFRTPLTVISGMAGQIKNDPKQWLEKGSELIQNNSQQLLSLINQILDLRKLESGALKVHLIQADVLPYLKYIAGSFSPMAMSNGIKIHFLANPKKLEMDYDPDKFLHIFSNLLSNAIKYSEAGDDIYFQVDHQKKESKEAILIQIKDTGQGISPEALPHIFDRFYQVEDLPSQKPQGSGIGLALTQELVKLLNGQISAESEPGEGTTFQLVFPVTHQAPLQTHYPELLSLDNLSRKSIQSSNIDISEKNGLVEAETQESLLDNGQELPVCLIVEDNADVRLYLKATLQNDYTILEAIDGEEGIEMAIEQVPDLIVSDVMMPKKNGFILCDTLKQDERTSHIPIILLTAKADFESKIEGLKKGADAYLPKPFKEEELLVRLQQLLELRKKIQTRYQNLSGIPLASEIESLQIEDAFIQKLRQLILDNIADEDFGTPQLYRALRISRTQLYNKVKALTGHSVSSLVKSIKLEKAKELLQTTDLNISEVAYEIGISNPAYFSRIYAENFGESPTESRRKQ